MTATFPRTEPETLQPLAQDSVAGVVHDLGNYIQVAMSAVTIMRRQADIAGFQGLGTIAAHATDALERAGALVRRSIERADTSQDEDVDVDMCLTQMAHLFRYACGPGIRIKLHVGLVPRIRCSRLDLQNALLNLALNARDAMPAAGTLTITALLADGPEIPEVEIVVRDTGTGMAPETLAHALERRFSTKPLGSGMGLAGVKEFVERSGGRMSIDSVRGAGTSVTLRLPAAPD
jgi:signal transduction histidine kinase